MTNEELEARVVELETECVVLRRELVQISQVAFSAGVESVKLHENRTAEQWARYARMAEAASAMLNVKLDAVRAAIS